MADLVIQKTLVDKINEAAKKIQVVEIGVTFKKVAELANGLPAYVNQVWTEHVSKLPNPKYNAADGITNVMTQVDQRVSDLGEAIFKFATAYQKGVKQAGRASEDVEKAIAEANEELTKANALLAIYQNKVGTPEQMQEMIEEYAKYQLAGSLADVKKHAKKAEDCDKKHADYEVIKAAAQRCEVSHADHDDLKARTEACDKEHADYYDLKARTEACATDHADYDALKLLRERVDAVKQAVADHNPAYRNISTKEFDKLIT